MDSFFAALILAIVQGITEWIPVSSSGHLVLFHTLLGYHPPLLFDVALHFGTLMSVFVYFGKDIMDILEALLKRRFHSQPGRLGLLLLLATIPAGVIGLLFHAYIEAFFSSLLITALGFAITGLVLFIASSDFFPPTKRTPSFPDAFLVGLAQAVAILPGISRSGTTLSAGLLRGLDEKSAMRFSFLLSIPAIFGAGIIEIGNNSLSPELLWATLLSFIIGLLTIHLFLNFVSKSRKNLRWFAAYVLALAFGILMYLLFF